MLTEPLTVTLQVVAVLEQLDVPYFIGGSMASPEDIILAKLEWYQMGGRVSDRQWNDVQNVIRVQVERLDLPYLRRSATELAILDLLERALEQAIG